MVHYNSYNQAKSIQTVSDIIGRWPFVLGAHRCLLVFWLIEFVEFLDCALKGGQAKFAALANVNNARNPSTFFDAFSPGIPEYPD